MDPEIAPILQFPDGHVFFYLGIIGTSAGAFPDTERGKRFVAIKLFFFFRVSRFLIRRALKFWVQA